MSQSVEGVMLEVTTIIRFRLGTVILCHCHFCGLGPCLRTGGGGDLHHKLL